MSDVPVLTLGAWRLFACAVVNGAIGAVQLYVEGAEGRRNAKREWYMTIPAGALLMLHFWLWLSSLRYTTLVHSSVLVTMTPAFFAGYAIVARTPVSRGELGGTCIAITGAVVMSLAAARTGADEAFVPHSTLWRLLGPPEGAREGQGATHAPDPSVFGDALALAAAAAFCGYLAIGRRVRAWMPLFSYTFGVNFTAAVLFAVLTLSQGASLAAQGAAGLFGFLSEVRFFVLTAFVSIVPGTIGHSGFSAVIRYIHPLTLTLACNLEPSLASFLGWAVGVAAAPGWISVVGGAVVSSGAIWATIAQGRREAAERAAAQGKALALPAGGGGRAAPAAPPSPLASAGSSAPATSGDCEIALGELRTDSESSRWPNGGLRVLRADGTVSPPAPSDGAASAGGVSPPSASRLPSFSLPSADSLFSSLVSSRQASEAQFDPLRPAHEPSFAALPARLSLATGWSRLLERVRGAQGKRPVGPRDGFVTLATQDPQILA